MSSVTKNRFFSFAIDDKQELTSKHRSRNSANNINDVLTSASNSTTASLMPCKQHPSFPIQFNKNKNCDSLDVVAECFNDHNDH